MPQTIGVIWRPWLVGLAGENWGLLRRSDVVARRVKHGTAGGLDAQLASDRMKFASKGESAAHIQ
jgi:hypothetical protein